MADRISVGGIRAIFAEDQRARDQFPNPIFQVLQKKLINPQAGAPERWRVVFSDTEHYVQSMLATQHNHIAASNVLQKGCFVKLTEYITNHVKDKKILIVLNFEVMEELEVQEKIGDPQQLPAPGDMPAAPAQNQAPQQQNTSTSTGQFYGNRPQQGGGGVAPQAARQAPKFSNQNQNRGGGSGAKSNVVISPIESLSPYQNRWTIKARCTQKSEIKTWQNQRGEGKLFSVNLLDQTGEIKCTGFNDQCDQLYDVFVEGDVYYISKCRVNMAKKQFSNLDNDYELTFERDSEVEKCDDTDNIPKPTFNFVTLADLQGTEPNAIIDVVGVLQEVGDVSEFNSKTTNKPYSKRELTLVDNTGYQVRLTVWGKQAQSFETPAESVLAFKAVKVSDFGGRSLSASGTSTMSVDPDIDEAHKLKGWYEAEGRGGSYSSHAGMGSSMGAAGGRTEDFKTIKQAKDENLGMSEKTDYFSVRATIVYIRQENVSYEACLTPECNKKVTDVGNGEWRCEKCNILHPRPQHRYIMTISVNDATDQCWFSVFDDVGKLIMGVSADELQATKEADDKAYGDLFNGANAQTFNFRVRAKMDTYQDQQRVRYQVLGATPLNYAMEASKLADQIRQYQMND